MLSTHISNKTPQIAEDLLGWTKRLGWSTENFYTELIDLKPNHHQGLNFKNHQKSLYSETHVCNPRTPEAEARELLQV